MAAASVILGLSMLTVSHLKAEHFWLGWLPYFRVTLLTLGSTGSLWLAFQLIRHPKGTSCGARSTAKIGQKVISGLAMTFPVGLMVSVWSLVFFVW